jgi:uncharacterized repeat protein (TIGR01451 family)
MLPILAMALLSLSLGAGSAGAEATPSAVEVSTVTLTIPTYPYAGFLESRHSDEFNTDYEWLDWSSYDASSPQPTPQDYDAVVMENPWLVLTFLPELGGRLYGVKIKATGEELLYQNPVIKPTHWGPTEQGWWLGAGGLEWCLPVEEHGYEWGIPWSYSVTTAAGGSTVTLWDTLSDDRVRARITVFLPADEAAFEITPRLENPTGAPVSFKFWANAALAPGMANTVGSDLRFVVPIDEVTVHSRGDEFLPGPGGAMAWPVYEGTDYSRLGNWNRWLGFFARPQAEQDWDGVYDLATLRGVARVFPHDVAVGVKGFAFGWQDPIDSSVWTDDGSTYAELHGGPSPTYWDSITLGPGQALEWTETWVPLRDLPALTVATKDLVLGLRDLEPGVWLGILAAQQQSGLSARLWRASDCTLLWHQDGLNLAPGQAFSLQLPDLGLSAGQVHLGVFRGSELLAATTDRFCRPPESQVHSLNSVKTTTEFTVSWSGTDLGGGLAGFDIQVRDGDADAPWTAWLLDTTTTSAVFSGEDGHTYTFRSRARDSFGNVEEWPPNKWQDTFTTVLLQPAPVLITSQKVAQPLHVRRGDILEFQIQLNNSGNLGASVQITDPLPAYLELTAGPYSTQAPDPELVSGAISWQGSLAAGQQVVAIGFDARLVDVPAGGVVSNSVWIDDGVHPVLRRQVTVSAALSFYLPIVLKAFP